MYFPHRQLLSSPSNARPGMQPRSWSQETPYELAELVAYIAWHEDCTRALTHPYSLQLYI